jgi:hypothetical protein
MLVRQPRSHESKLKSGSADESQMLYILCKQVILVSKICWVGSGVIGIQDALQFGAQIACV